MSPIIKVCGMRDPENIRAVESLGISLMGFIFWPRSSRYVSEKPAYLPTKAKRVGVFVDEEISVVRQTAESFSLDIIQLHGHESPDYLRRLEDMTLIKAFNIATEDDLQQTRAYKGVADYFLFDTKGKLAGGNGAQFDWGVLDSYHGRTPFLLSGGIGPADAQRVTAFSHDRCVGFDLNSRFETSPGVKNVEALRQFLASGVRHAPQKGW